MKNFGELFKQYRLKSELYSLTSFADAFAKKGHFYELSIFCHWERGRRVPTKRSILVSLTELFILKKAIISLEEANEFLESAEQGYLTKKEQEKLFPLNNYLDSNPMVKQHSKIL